MTSTTNRLTCRSPRYNQSQKFTIFPPLSGRPATWPRDRVWAGLRAGGHLAAGIRSHRRSRSLWRQCHLAPCTSSFPERRFRPLPAWSASPCRSLPLWCRPTSQNCRVEYLNFFNHLFSAHRWSAATCVCSFRQRWCRWPAARWWADQPLPWQRRRGWWSA